MKFIKPMLPTLAKEAPKGNEWVYEKKYDGFRCQLHWEGNSLQIFSRNGYSLLPNFPELELVRPYFQELFSTSSFILDGELCCITSNGREDFDFIQKRGRLKNVEKILTASQQIPATFLAFDLLKFNNDWTISHTYEERKHLLNNNFTKVIQQFNHFAIIEQTSDLTEVWRNVVSQKGEGIIAKKKSSKWMEGKRTVDWLKIKNYKEVNVIVTGYDETNGYFIASVLKEGHLMEVGTFIHGMSLDEQQALRMIIKKNAFTKQNNKVVMKPSLSIKLSIIGLAGNSLREPRFISFRLNKNWEDCTWEQLHKAVFN